MKRKNIVIVFLILCSAVAEGLAAESEKIGKILFIGNSITKCAPSPDAHWDGNWGMAASAEDKDYAHHVLHSIIDLTGSQPLAMIENIAKFEREYDTYDVAGMRKDLVEFHPDVMVLAIGENVPSLKNGEDKSKFKESVLKLLQALQAGGHPAILVRSCFWADPVKDKVLRQVCGEVGGIYVDISNLCKDESNYARSERKFDNSGVAAHPGDKGMQAIAFALVEAMKTNHLLPKTNQKPSK